MKKRFFALFLCLAMLLTMIPIGISAEANKTVLAFSSDVHNNAANDAATRFTSWTNAVKADKGTVDYMGFCGDMAASQATEAEYWAYTASFMNKVADFGIEACYTTGGYEFYNGNFSTTKSSVKKAFTVDGEAKNAANYRVYCLGSENWTNSQDNYTTAQVTALSEYLAGVDSTKPIFVVTHYALHCYGSGYNVRATKNADLVIDALNEAAADGKTIVLIWGHNHTLNDPYYDFVTEPGSLLKVDSSGTEKTANFYYAPAGCMSDSEYNDATANVFGKGLVVELTNSTMTFAYYNKNGESMGEETYNVSITTNAPTEEPAKPTFNDATTPESGKTYVVVANGLALSASSSSAIFSDNGEGDRTDNYRGLDNAAFSDTMKVSDDLIWEVTEEEGALTLKNGDAVLNATYKENDYNGHDSRLLAGDTADTWTIEDGKLLSANAERYLAIKENASGKTFFTVSDVDSAAEISFYEYSKPTIVKGYQDTELAEGNTYVVGVVDNGKVKAICVGNAENAVKTATVNYTASANNIRAYTETTDTSVLWTYTNGTFENDGLFIFPTAENTVLTHISGKTVEFSNGTLSFEDKNGTYYVTYNNGTFGTSNNANDAAEIAIFNENADSALPHAHKYTTETTEAKCLEDGKIIYTCECGDTYTEIIHAPGHQFVDGRCIRCYAKCAYLTVANTEKVERGETFTVTLNISSNPGIAYLKLALTYDSALELVSAENGTAFKNSFTSSSDIAKSPYILQWLGAENDTGNGTLATLTFKVKSSASNGDYNITVECKEVYDSATNDSNVVITNSSVKVETKSLGDINGDGKISAVDGHMIKSLITGKITGTEYQLAVADINGDGKITAVDDHMIKKLILGSK